MRWSVGQKVKVIKGWGSFKSGEIVTVTGYYNDGELCTNGKRIVHVFGMYGDRQSGGEYEENFDSIFEPAKLEEGLFEI